jgi:outer membrane biosynthesis protein TonB
MQGANLPSARALFDAAVHPAREPEIEALGLEVLARPGWPAPDRIRPGALVVRCALGEERLAVLCAVERLIEGRAALNAAGLTCAGWGDGLFVEVNCGAGERRKALRIAGPERVMVRDTVILQPSRMERAQPAYQPEEEARPPRRTRPRRAAARPPAPQPRPKPQPASPPPPTPQPRPQARPQHKPSPPPRSTPPAPPKPQPMAAKPRRAGAVANPVAPPRALLAITGSVGRGGQNLPADVTAVQDRLVELRVLDQNDAAAERPVSATVAESALSRTIDAIESFQRQMGIAVGGKVDVRSAVRTDLDRAVPQPDPTELSAVAGERNAISQTVSRGLTLSGAVGATDDGNAPDDVRVVQRRLIELGKLPESHPEGAAAGFTGAIPQAALQATIAALRNFQADVRFWTARGTISGAVTAGVVAPSDATTALLDRITVYRTSVQPHPISFRDHIVSAATRSETGVMFKGTSPPSAIPVARYQALGLTAAQAAALKLVSSHEGNFDAINTYDRAAVSVGFIQFAGGRGLPRYLALLKARQAAKFRDLLQRFGIDVEFTVVDGAIRSPRIIVLDTGRPAVLRAQDAEAAIRDDKKLTAALILSGRDRDVQLVQIEAAVRDYVLPALNGPVSWAVGHTARLGAILRSQKGMAALFDRAIQEGVEAGRRRFERVIQRVVGSADPKAPKASLNEVQRREGDVLAELERDLQAAADVAARIARARASLDTLIAAANAPGGSLAGVLAQPELADARRALRDARTGLAGVINVTSPPRVTVEATLQAMLTTVTSEEARLALTPPPPSLAALSTALTASRPALATVAGPVSTSTMFLARIQRIRRSTLDTALTEVA